MPDNTCVCCGEVIPEGRQICLLCEGENEVQHFHPQIPPVITNGDRWIPCSERMPEDRDTVLTCDINKNVRKCEYFAEFHKFNPEFCDYYAMDVSYVTHWMPLPEPPEKE